MQTSLSVFSFESEEERQFREVRIIEIEGEQWFVVSDIAKVLGFVDSDDAVRMYCRLKGIMQYSLNVSGAGNEVTIVNEPNVYRLILNSKLPSAERFEEWLFEEVVPSIRKKGYYGKIDRTQLPNFVERYRDNMHNLPSDHFSVISEMYIRLYMELEKVGYPIPDRGEKGRQMMPDISVGKFFIKYLKDKNSEFYGNEKKYIHKFPDGKEKEANMYPNEAIPVFIKFIYEKWLPEHAVNYFKDKDPLALEYLPKLIGESSNQHKFFQ